MSGSGPREFPPPGWGCAVRLSPGQDSKTQANGPRRLRSASRRGDGCEESWLWGFVGRGAIATKGRGCKRGLSSISWHQLASAGVTWLEAKSAKATNANIGTMSSVARLSWVKSTANSPSGVKK